MLFEWEEVLENRELSVSGHQDHQEDQEAKEGRGLHLVWALKVTKITLY